MFRRQLNLAFSCHCDATTWNRLPIFHACFSAGFLSRLYQTFGYVSFVCLASHRRHRAAAPTLAVKSRVAGTQASLCSQLGVQPSRLRLRNSQNQGAATRHGSCVAHLPLPGDCLVPPAVLYAAEDSALSYHWESCCVTTPLMHVPLIRYSYTTL